MSSSKTTYIPPATTFILGRKPTLQRPANGDKGSANHHWNTIRETLRKGNGFSVPDERLFEERPKSQEQDKRKRYSNTNSVEKNKNPARRKQSRNSQVKEDEAAAPSARRQPSRRSETQDNNALKNPVQRKSLRKNGLPTELDETMKISKQQSHFSAPDRVYDGTVEKESDNGFSPATIRSSDEDRDWQAPAAIKDHENNSEYRENSDTASDVNSEIVPMSRFGRTNSVYDPDDVRKRTESNDIKSQKKNNQPSIYDDNRDSVGDRDTEISDDGPMYDQIKPVNEDEKLQKRRADDIENSKSDIGSDVESSLDGLERSEDNNSLQSHSDQDDDLKAKNKKDGKLRFLKKCAPSFAKKILDTIEKRKNECQLCLDDVAAKFKKQQMEKGEPVFTSYSCENGDENKEGFKSSMKKRVSNLVGGFYSKACTGVQMISDILFETDPEKDGTWTGMECEYGVRCLPNYDNTVEDHTLYICSHCFNEERDRHIFVSTKYLDDMYGCCTPVFITRSFENLPPHCEKMLARMNEKSRKILLKIAGRKCDMKGGVRCNSKVKIKEEANNQPSENVPTNNSSSTS